MIDIRLLERFLEGVRGQALIEGYRYAKEQRVGPFIGSPRSVTSTVRGRSGDFEVVLWSEGGNLHHRCTCPSWRNPCKHIVAAASSLQHSLKEQVRRQAKAEVSRVEIAGPQPDLARKTALEERAAAARRENGRLALEEPPFVRVFSPSGFAYRVQMRGGPDGPHGCECPDFEANRLHTCKHVERVRGWMNSPRTQVPRLHARAALRPRVYLHFGEVVEPRLFGRPTGAGSRVLARHFDDSGHCLRPMARDQRRLAEWLRELGEWVEEEALAWLESRVARLPELPRRDFKSLLPALHLAPYGFQWEGAEFLARTGRALLADEMGLGKTVQAIVAAAALRKAADPVRRVTVVCPASLRGGWREEIRRWIGEEARLLEGPAHTRDKTIRAGAPWLITHFEQVLRDWETHRDHPPDLLIVDEAQRAKGLTTRTARVLKAIQARHIFALTGTPLENRLEEAYCIAQLIDQRLLPPLWQIDRDHFVREEKKKRVVMYRDLHSLRSRLAPAFLRRRKEDVALQLPARLQLVALVPMHPAVESSYYDVMHQVAIIACKKVILPADLERMQRLLVIARRACNGPHMLGIEANPLEVPKLAELKQALTDLCLGEGRKALVFSEWTDMTDAVELVCRKIRLPVYHLNGGVPVKQRPELIRGFHEHAGPAVFLSTDAGGVGLNLQAAEVVINLDLPWNPARLEQRIARAHRIGSKRTVQVLLLVTEDTLEQRLLQVHETKRKVLANIWARDGEDHIAAPGGSGAFQQLVRELLGSLAPPVPRPEPARSSAQVVGVPAPAQLEAPAAAPPAKGEGVRPEAVQPSLPGLDLAALNTAIAGITPVLSADQRQAMARIFQALADSLKPPS